MTVPLGLVKEKKENRKLKLTSEGGNNNNHNKNKSSQRTHRGNINKVSSLKIINKISNPIAKLRGEKEKKQINKIRNKVETLQQMPQK